MESFPRRFLNGGDASNRERRRALTPRAIGAHRFELGRVLEAEWQTRLVKPSAGYVKIVTVSTMLEEWLERHHGTFTFRLTQTMTSHNYFGRFLWRIGRQYAFSSPVSSLC